MLLCTRAATLPMTMLATARTAIATDQSGCRSGMTPEKSRRKAANAAAFTAVDMNAVTVVGAPS